MTFSFFIKSHKRDFPWLEWLRGSIRKHNPNFFCEIVLCLPEGESFDWPEAKIVHIRESFGGYLFQQAVKCYADFFCHQGDIVVFGDSDTIITRPLEAEDFIKDGKPIWLFTDFANARDDQSVWIKPMERFVGRRPTKEVMRRHCFAWPRRFFNDLRQFCRFKHDKELVDYIKAQEVPGNLTALTFSEFNCAGWFAHEYCHGQFSWVQDSEARPAYVYQGHTWAGEERMHQDLAKFRELLEGNSEEKGSIDSEVVPEGKTVNVSDSAGGHNLTIPLAIEFLASQVKDNVHKARIIRSLKKAWQGKGEAPKAKERAVSEQRNVYKEGATVTISGGGGKAMIDGKKAETTLLCIHSYPGANETVERHWPNYLKFGADRIVGIGTTDGKCIFPCESVNIGENAYMKLKGKDDHLCRRLLDTVKWCLTQPEDRFAIIEYDTIPLKKMPKWQGISASLTGGKVNGSKATQFFHNPWLFTRDTGVELVRALEDSLGDSAEYPNNSPDLFFGLACERAGIKVGCNFKLFTRNRLDTPGDLDLAVEAALAGVHVIHGVKTAEEHQTIMRALNEKHLELSYTQ